MMPRLLSALIMLSGMLSVTLAVAADSGTHDVETDVGANGREADVEPNLILPVAVDLKALGKKSRRATVPILLMYSTEDCQYCARLENEVLGPMRLGGDDPGRVIIRKVIMEEYETLRDFYGKKRNAESYAYAQGVSVTPTVMLVDENGKELVPRIVGYQTPGLYDAYLDEAINVSGSLLEQRQ